MWTGRGRLSFVDSGQQTPMACQMKTQRKRSGQRARWQSLTESECLQPCPHPLRLDLGSTGHGQGIMREHGDHGQKRVRRACIQDESEPEQAQGRCETGQRRAWMARHTAWSLDHAMYVTAIRGRPSRMAHDSGETTTVRAVCSLW